MLLIEEPLSGTVGATRRRHPWLGFALICGAIPAAHAENWRITPTLAVNETLTNNLYLNSTNRTSDLVTGITPGISIDGKGARASLRLSYAFTEQIYARESSSNGHQNALTAIGTLEAIDDWLFIDATGSISQQYLSAFGTISPSTANVNNQTETSSYSISPYIKGRFLTSTEYFCATRERRPPRNRVWRLTSTPASGWAGSMASPAGGRSVLGAGCEQRAQRLLARPGLRGHALWADPDLPDQSAMARVAHRWAGVEQLRESAAGDAQHFRLWFRCGRQARVRNCRRPRTGVSSVMATTSVSVTGCRSRW
jgi:hypothetical protein